MAVSFRVCLTQFESCKKRIPTDHTTKGVAGHTKPKYHMRGIIIVGLNLKDIVTRKKTTLDSFRSKTVSIDAYNAMYQFLSSIRGRDGMPLVDYRGNVTSHLSGLLHRCSHFMSLGIKQVWVFDGKPPSLKTAEIERRRTTKTDAILKYEMALADGNMADVRKYAQQISTIQDYMIDESKTLLSLFGIPHIQATSEGEATAAHLTKTGHAWASASQDYDSVLFGAQRLVRNFTNSGRRKLPNRNMYVPVQPELILLDDILAHTGLSQDQLIDVGILIGTDFNPNGFYRIGPKTALKLIKKHKRLEDIPKIQNDLDDVPYDQIRRIFAKPDVTDVDSIEFGKPDYHGITGYLQDHSFNEMRVEQTLNRVKKAHQIQEQSLDRWL